MNTAVETGVTFSTLTQLTEPCPKCGNTVNAAIVNMVAHFVCVPTGGCGHSWQRSLRFTSLTPGLTFNALRHANVQRLPLFRNRRGEPAHSQPDGSDWSLGEWCNAITGELGEAANLIKKIQRGDVTLDDARRDLADELADVQTYLDLLAFRAGIDLGEATVTKWNRVSERVGVPVRLAVLASEQQP